MWKVVPPGPRQTGLSALPLSLSLLWPGTPGVSVWTVGESPPACPARGVHDGITTTATCHPTGSHAMCPVLLASQLGPG